MKIIKNGEPSGIAVVLFTLFLSVALLEGGTAWAGPQKPCDLVIRKLQKRYNSTKDIKADFVQETRVPGDQQPITASGAVYFKRPHLMRWDYVTPEKELIVTSGTKVYVYEPEANQVSVLSRKQFLSSRLSRAFFFGKGDIERDFRVIGCLITREGWVLKLEPREPVPQIRRLRLTLDRENFLIKKTEIEDQMGSKTVILFKKIKVNTGVDPKLFQFVPPEGVEIFNAR